jgi:uncharacterized protein (DUF2252 family)
MACTKTSGRGAAMTEPASTSARKVEATAAADAARDSGEQPKAVVHLTPGERATRGKAARAEVPRSSHAVWEAPSGRPDPVGLLEEQGESRVQELVPIRYGRMLASPFAFYRGAAYLMASDLASTPRSGFVVQACGDAHVSNFGLFGSPERELLFDINDFDETNPGPWEWDVKRLAASLAIAGRNNGFTDKERAEVVLRATGGYRTAMREFAAMRNLEVWYAHGRMEEGLPRVKALLDKKNLKEADRVVTKAKTKDSLEAFAKLTRVVDGERRIISEPPLIVPIEELLPPDQAEEFLETIHGLIRAYRRTLQGDRKHLLEDFRFSHLARKVVGVGSVGTRAWIALMLGRDDQDPLFLQAKEAQASVLEPFVGKSRYANHGQRVVEGQRLMQAASDIFLGWNRVSGIDGVTRDFYLRQLRDWKGSWAPEAMVPEVMSLYGGMCGWTLARAHARSGDRVAIASYLGGSDAFDRAIVSFSEAYADQNDRDYAALQTAVKANKIKATFDV